MPNLDTVASIAYVNPDHLSNLRSLGQDVVLGGEKDHALIKKTFQRETVPIYDGRRTDCTLAKNGFTLCQSPFVAAPEVSDFEDEAEIINKVYPAVKEVSTNTSWPNHSLIMARGLKNLMLQLVQRETGAELVQVCLPFTRRSLIDLAPLIALGRYGPTY
jgi:hypothetical protein